MPGLNITFKPKGITAQKKEKIIRGLSSVQIKPKGSIRTIYSDINLVVSLISNYEGYPFRQFKENNCHIFLEGYIFSHNRGDPVAKLRELAAALDLSDAASVKIIGDFVKSVDGEFLAALYNEKTGCLAIFNDILGRLPVHFHKENDTLYVSREIKFINALLENLTLSAHSLAQSLTFLFPVGERTLFTDTRKMLPARLLISKSDDNRLKEYTLYEWNFSINKISGPARTFVDELEALYLEGVKSRAGTFDSHRNILALSGGLDSRTVLAGLMKMEEPFTAIIFVDPRGATSKDLAVAKEIASIYGFDLNIFGLPGIDIGRMNQLIYMKDGQCLNSIMGTVNRSHEIINEKYGENIIYYTGAGGGLVLAPRCPIRSIKQKELLNQIINRNTQTFIEDATAIVRIDPMEFRYRLNEHFLSYPEETLEDKYGHYMIFEHLFNFSFEGDDRERYYFWNCAFFYSAPFFKKAMQISDTSKMNHRLFSEFLERLYPGLASIKYANWGFPITSPLTPYYLSTKNWLLERPRLAALVRKIGKYRQLSSVRGKLSIKDPDILILKNNIERMISECPELNDYLATNQITRLLPKWNNLYILYAVNNLLTYLRFLRDSFSSLKVDFDN